MEDIFVPPKAPKDLCFGELDFVQKEFDIDAFLQEHRKNASLEKMRDDLGIYLKTLRSAMIDLINKDYADFVNLSSNLIGLDSAIENLETPLGQLREEVLQVRQALEDAITDMTATMEKRRQIRERKRCLHSLIRVHKSITKLSQILSSDSKIENDLDPDILERAATELNQLKFHASRCKSEMSSNQEQKIEELEHLLKSSLNDLFVSCVTEKKSKTLIRCLRIYVTLEKVPVAEEVVKTRIIGPVVRSIVDENVLQSEPSGLQGIYCKLENILDEELKDLLEVTVYSERVPVKGFNFLVNSFWPEIEEQIEDNLGLVFAPGNAELFHQRYTETLGFLERLEKKCSSKEIQVSFKNHPQYSQFLKKWNLPVYFQIRFQEIAGSAESVMCDDASSNSIIKEQSLRSIENDDFSLYATRMVWDCILRTFSDQVFLVKLLHKFWKLALQLCSRYREWCRTASKQHQKIATENETELEFNSSKLELFVFIYADTEKLINKLSGIVDIVVKKFPFTNAKMLDSMNGSLRIAMENLQTCHPEITEAIVNDLLNQSEKHLKQISDIPRLFRRTNREIPTKPCAYVKNSLNCLVHFHGMYGMIIPKVLEKWLVSTLSSLTEKYLAAVTQVLTSVQKTEESLRRLKKIRDKSIGVSSAESTGVSDDEKIRIQLAIDVASYVGIVKDLGIEESKVSHLQELKQLVESAVKTRHEIK